VKPPKFEYHAPSTLEETIHLLGKYGEDARILAGGQSLVPLMNFRIMQPRALISINHCTELAYLQQRSDGLLCGALTRQIEAELSPVVQQRCPLLAAALPWVGGISNRNRGTVCGSLAHADPLAELTAVAAALDATFMIAGINGRREVQSDEFFIADLTTCIEPGEMLEAVRFPQCGKDASAAFVEVGNRWHGFAVAGVAAHLEFAIDGRFDSVRLAAIGVGATPVRLTVSEKILQGTHGEPGALREAAEAASLRLEPPGGFHADAAYKLQVLGTLVERAIAKAQLARTGKDRH
jgi:CO/xanthine dehydrogenase FAD-binding subunit